jgi:hypothetical protein
MAPSDTIRSGRPDEKTVTGVKRFRPGDFGTFPQSHSYGE